MAGVRYELPDGRVLLDDVSFRVGEGAKVALVGANGAGKTTLLRIITGDLVPHAGVVTRSGGLGVMRQMVNLGLGEAPTVSDLLLSVSPPRIRAAAVAVDRCERALMDSDDEATQMTYAEALAEYADAGGYDVEVTWDVCTVAGLGVPYDKARYRELRTLSGGEQKRLVLEFLLRGPDPRRAHAQQEVSDRRLLAETGADHLPHHAEPAAAGHYAGVWLEVSGDDAEQRRLAGTVGSDQRHLGALADAERHVVQQHPAVGQLVAHSGDVHMSHVEGLCATRGPERT